jgi:hypothetical protein
LLDPTIDRRLASERAKHQLKGRCTTKPGSLLKSQIPVRTWADWDDAQPAFVEIDLVSHDGRVVYRLAVKRRTQIVRGLNDASSGSMTSRAASASSSCSLCARDGRQRAPL